MLVWVTIIFMKIPNQILLLLRKSMRYGQCYLMGLDANMDAMLMLSLNLLMKV